MLEEERKKNEKKKMYVNTVLYLEILGIPAFRLKKKRSIR